MGLTYFEDIKKLKAYLVQDVQSGYKGIYRMYLGNERIYPNAGTVTYHVDTNVTYTEEIDIDESILNPSTFTPSKSGWTFVGWRKDTTASGSVLSDEVMTGDDVTLYAVFSQTITLSYDGNGATGGNTESQVNYRYYNNGTISNAAFVLRDNGFIKTNYSFVNWRMGSISGTAYNAGASVTLESSTTFYANWKVIYTTSVVTYGGSGVRVSDNGEALIGSISTDSVHTRTCTGNVVKFTDSSRYLRITANANCTVSINYNLTLTAADGWTWYSWRNHYYINNSKVANIFDWGSYAGNGQNPENNNPHGTISVNLNAGQTLGIYASGGTSGNDRSGFSWTYTLTCTLR